MRKSKLQVKIWQATLKRKQERQANNRRAAWNRVGRRFRLSKEELDQAKKTGLNPYRLLRDQSVTTESARAYIQYGGMLSERQYDSLADHAIDLEIARLEKLDDIFDE
jgi:hypothetical protein